MHHTAYLTRRWLLVGALVVTATAVAAIACGGGTSPSPVRPMGTEASTTTTRTASSSASVTPAARSSGSPNDETEASTTTTRTASSSAGATPAARSSGSPNDETVASTAATSREQLPVVAFSTSTGGTAVLPIEVPPQTEYGIGLSGRRTLDERGMLFYYAQPVTQAFWMKQTHIDLAIAFVDGAGRIVEVREMRAESLDLLQPATPYRISLEAPRGWYAAHGITAGATVHLRFRLADYLPGAEQIGGGS